MSNEQSQIEQMKPYLIIAGVLFVILLAVIFWPASNDSDTANKLEENETSPMVVGEPAPNASPNEFESETGITDMVSPDVFEPPQAIEEVELNGESVVEEYLAEEVPEEIVVDTSDAAVKSALISIAKSPILGKLLVNDSLIQKFVINVSNLADEELTIKDSLVVTPDGEFETYNQAGGKWIDRASYTRYTPYVDTLESMEVSELLSIYDIYKADIDERFAEISRPGARFDDALIDAINELLDTPEVPMPIEVFSESVVYKYKDPRIEALSGPQKQLLRTGPDNMRRIKDVLRTLKDALEARES